jgi:hypothetical protein
LSQLMGFLLSQEGIFFIFVLGLTKMAFQAFFPFQFLSPMSSDKLKYLFFIFHHSPLITMLMKFPNWARSTFTITWWPYFHPLELMLTWLSSEKFDHPWCYRPLFHKSCLLMIYQDLSSSLQFIASSFKKKKKDQ